MLLLALITGAAGSVRFTGPAIVLELQAFAVTLKLVYDPCVRPVTVPTPDVFEVTEPDCAVPFVS